jgi:hypothetical protein
MEIWPLENKASRSQLRCSRGELLRLDVITAFIYLEYIGTHSLGNRVSVDVRYDVTCASRRVSVRNRHMAQDR